MLAGAVLRSVLFSGMTCCLGPSPAPIKCRQGSYVAVDLTHIPRTSDLPLSATLSVFLSEIDA